MKVKTILIVAFALMTGAIWGESSIRAQLTDAFNSQYRTQMSSSSISWSITFGDIPSNVGEYDIPIQFKTATTTLYRTVYDPEMMPEVPQLKDHVSVTGLAQSDISTLNNGVLSHFLSGFIEVEKLPDGGLDEYSTANVRFIISEEGKVVGEGNQGAISFSNVRIFELYSDVDVVGKKVFVRGSAEWNEGKRKYQEKCWEIGSACAIANEKSEFLLKLLACNKKTKISDDELSMYTRDMQSDKSKALRSMLIDLKKRRDSEIGALRASYKKIKASNVQSADEKDKELKALKEKVDASIKSSSNSIDEIEKQLVKERRSLYEKIQNDPASYVTNVANDAANAVTRLKVFLK